MPTKFISFTRLSEFKDFLDGLFATKASLADYQSKITSDNKLSHDLVSGLGSAATEDAASFATAVQGTKADNAIPNPSIKESGAFLRFDGTDWVASDVPDTGVLSVSNAAGDDSITIGGTAANPTLKVKENAYDINGAAAAVQGNTNSTVKDAMDAAAIAQSIANAAVAANTPITGGTKTKITYDNKGLVTGGTDLTAADIPVLDASKIATGTFADDKIASAANWNAKQDALQFTGTYNASTNKVVLADYVADAVALAANGGREVVTILPEPTEENYKKKMIYLYQPTGATTYEEYIIAKNGNNYVREKIGDTDIQIGNYWAKAELIEASAQDIENMFD